MDSSEQPLQWTEEHQKLAEELASKINIEPRYRHSAITGAWLRFRRERKPIQDLKRWMLKNLKRGARDENKTHPVPGRSKVTVAGEKVYPSVQEFDPRKFKSTAMSTSSHDKALIVWSQMERVLPTAEGILSPGEIDATLRYLQTPEAHFFYFSPAQRAYIERHVVECQDCSSFLAYLIEHPLDVLGFCHMAIQHVGLPAHVRRADIAPVKLTAEYKARFKQHRKILQLGLAQLEEMKWRYTRDLLRRKDEIFARNKAGSEAPTWEFLVEMERALEGIAWELQEALTLYPVQGSGTTDGGHPRKAARKPRACSVCGEPGHNARRHANGGEATPSQPTPG